MRVLGFDRHGFRKDLPYYLKLSESWPRQEPHSCTYMTEVWLFCVLHCCAFAAAD